MNMVFLSGDPTAVKPQLVNMNSRENSKSHWISTGYVWLSAAGLSRTISFSQ